MDDAVRIIKSMGYSVRFGHWRPRRLSEKEVVRCPHCGRQTNGLGLEPYCRGHTSWEPAARGGKTVCVVLQNGEPVCSAAAYCSLEDSFCYRIGRAISAGRALKKLVEGT